MLTRRSHIWTGLAAVALSAMVVAAVACDLNPQPLPPGAASIYEPTDGGPLSPPVNLGGDAGAVDSGGFTAGGDADADVDAGAALDGSDGSDGTTGDGGDAGDLDGSSDGDATGDAE